MESIRATTQKLMRGYSNQRQTRSERVIKQGLKRFFTHKEQRHLAGYYFKDARMILHLDSSAWLYQLNLKKEQLLQYLNQALGPEQAIKEIVLRLDRNEAKN